MIIEKRLKFNDDEGIAYFLGIECKYVKDSKRINLVKKDGSYFDSGDVSYLIDDIVKKGYIPYQYDKEIGTIDTF